MSTPRLLAFGSSLRTGSLNRELARVAGETARTFGAEVTIVNLADFPMPIYNGDDESRHGLPPEARRFKKLLQTHDGFIISSAEYNGFFTAALKNAIDWASRTSEENEPPLSAFQGKTAALLSASPGALGGTRSVGPLRWLLGNIGVIVVPGQFSLSNAAPGSFAGNTLADESQQTRLAALLRQLTDLTSRLKA